MFPGSSAVEHSTVNRQVAGSNPARGAIFFFENGSWHWSHVYRTHLAVSLSFTDVEHSSVACVSVHNGESIMGIIDQNKASEQKRPADVNPKADDAVVDEGGTIASTFVKPANEKDTDDRPVVNPVTDGAF